MGRRELPVDPDSGPLAQFACDLRALRRSAGSPAYRALAREAHYSATSLSQAAAGNSLPSLEVTLAYVAACGGDAQRWRPRWEELAALLAADAGPVDAAGPRDGQAASATRLTGREADVAGLLVHGYTNAEIAGMLGIRERTVDGHLENIKQKVCESRRVRVAMRLKDLGYPPPAAHQRKSGSRG